MFSCFSLPLRPLPFLLGSLAALPSEAQAPPGWFSPQALGSDLPSGAWGEGGLWAAHKEGALATLAQSDGLGNSLLGAGLRLGGGWKSSRWDLAGEIRAFKTPDGGSRLRLQRFHITYRSRKGWETSLEQEPIEWGFGLQGGYLLGRAAEPFPRLRLQSPYKQVRLLGLSFGAWKGDAFLGRLERDRRMGEASQDPLFRQRAIQSAGSIQAPFLSGWRLEARFGEATELYMNYLNFWGGRREGVNLVEGYGVRDYLTAMFGVKDALVEGGLDFQEPNAIDQAGGYRNKARSASNSDVGVRFRSDALARLLGAEDVRIHISRGAKSVNLYPQRFLRRPLYYLGKDVEQDGESLWGGHFSEIWNRTARYSAPSPDTPNDAVGLMIRWPRLRAGVEYLDATNPTTQGHRPFEHGGYLEGFYRYGAPLGNAIAGEAVTWTLRLEWEATPNLQIRTLAYWGWRPFRDNPVLWSDAHPGVEPEKDRFLGFQPYLRWERRKRILEAGLSWQHHSASGHIPGNAKDGQRWFLDWGWKW